ncbi:MAG TPA: ATP-binding cassette domain-containing protein, partial [Acidimicrobiales bacterium]|nr:ATP-binding cassette domain-containing protein [Acidimicrobiales bacterium]
MNDIPEIVPVTEVPTAVAPTVSLTGCSKRYRSRTVLQDVDLDLRPGITGLLGPNGAGKTTLLRIVATELRHDAGTVRVLGRDPARAHDRHDIRCRLGYQPQEPGFYQGFSVTDFLDYVAILKEMADRRARRREVWRVVELVDLGPVARTAIRKLSGGMRRRVALAAALLGAPELLILDEPTTGLDPEQRMRFRQVVADLADECTIVLSTHLTDDVAALCDRVVVLDGGRTRFD